MNYFRYTVLLFVFLLHSIASDAKGFTEAKGASLFLASNAAYASYGQWQSAIFRKPIGHLMDIPEDDTTFQLSYRWSDEEPHLLIYNFLYKGRIYKHYDKEEDKPSLLRFEVGEACPVDIHFSSNRNAAELHSVAYITQYPDCHTPPPDNDGRGYSIISFAEHNESEYDFESNFAFMKKDSKEGVINYSGIADHKIYSGQVPYVTLESGAMEFELFGNIYRKNYLCYPFESSCEQLIYTKYGEFHFLTGASYPVQSTISASSSNSSPAELLEEYMRNSGFGR